MVKVKKANTLLVTFLVLSAIAAVSMLVFTIVITNQVDIQQRKESLRSIVLNVRGWCKLWK